MSEEKPIRVVMVCAMGMSSSLLEAKIIEAAAEAGVSFEMRSTDAADMARWDYTLKPIDVLLIAPQVRFKTKSLTQAASPYGVIVLNIDPVHFGMVEGGLVFQQILDALQGKSSDSSQG